MASACAYPICNGKIAIGNSIELCPSCGQTNQACSRCGATNRALARHCRACGASMQFPPPSAQVLIDGAGTFEQPPKRGQIDDTFWLAPTAYCGSLLCLSSSGQVYRLSPKTARATPIVAMGSGYGQGSFIIREIRAGGDWPEPWLIAASTQEVKGISLVTGAAKVFAEASDGESFVASSLDHYGAVEADSVALYLLKRKGPALCLSAVPLAGPAAQDFPLPCDLAAGPFRCGDTVFAYSAKDLYWISGAGLRSRPFTRGFAAWINSDTREFHVATGRLPYMVCGRSVYIPGTFGGTSALLLQHTRSGFGESSVVRFAEDATYRQSFSGQPVLALTGRIAGLADAAIRDLRLDSQIISRRPAFADGALAACFVANAGGERLRIFRQSESYDFPIGLFPRFADCMEYSIVGNSFVMAYLTDLDKMEFAVWSA